MFSISDNSFRLLALALPALVVLFRGLGLQLALFTFSQNSERLYPHLSLYSKNTGTGGSELLVLRRSHSNYTVCDVADKPPDV